MRQCVVILVILLGAVFCRAQQNLILNGRFEAFDTIAPCVAGDLSPSLGSSHVIQNWWNPTITSSDYYQRCDTGSFRIPLQISGSYQEDPYHLNAYVGLITLLNGGIYQEYIATHLKTSLLKNKHYEFKALVNSYDFNFYNTNIGFCLESDSIDRDTVSTYSPRHPANVYMTDSVIKSCIDWTDISIKFSPTIDSLRFLIIGTFPSVTPILIYRPTLSEICLPDSTSDPGVAYYLIDDVRVYCLDCDTLDTIDTTDTIPHENICAVSFPDAFTPNGDNINDTWKPLLTPACENIISIYLLKIFDCWDNEIFETTDKDEGWTGQHKEIGTYIYYLQYDDQKGTQKKTGSIELIR